MSHNISPSLTSLSETVSTTTYVAANGIMSNLERNDTNELTEWKETQT